MRATPFFLIALFAALQALIAAYWVWGGGTRQFVDVLMAFHGRLPMWTALAFSLQWHWLYVPGACIVWLLLVWARLADRNRAWRVSLGSLCVVLLMLYAMYPLHLIFAGH